MNRRRPVQAFRRSHRLCSAAGRRTPLHAFTLIELIVVIIIMAVLSAVAVPSYTRLYARAKFDGSVQEVVSIFRWARETAVETGLDTTVRFDPQAAIFIASAQHPEPTTDAPTVVVEQQEEQTSQAFVPRTYEIGEDIAVSDFQSYRQSLGAASTDSAEASTVRYRHDGSCDGARFLLSSSGGHRAMLEIAAATGKPSIIEEQE